MLKTYDDIIQNRTNEIFNEVQDIDAEIQSVTARLEKLKALKEMRIAEHQMLSNIQDRGLIVSPGSTKQSRMNIEDTIKRIFDKTGRPMSVGELFDELATFGFTWNSYQRGYQTVIRELGILENAGMRGMYQRIRG